MEFFTCTIFGICLPVTKRPLRSMTINVLSLNQPDLRPNGVHSIAVIRIGPSDLTGNAIRSLSSPTFRHFDGNWCLCLLVHHHQMKNTAVLAPTAAAVTYANRVLSIIIYYNNFNKLDITTQKLWTFFNYRYMCICSINVVHVCIS